MADWGVEVAFHSEQALGVACSLLQTLFDELAQASADDARQRDKAKLVLDRFPLPAAAFGGIAGSQPITNAAWRLLFPPETQPARLGYAIDRVTESGRAQSVREMAIQLTSYLAYFDLTVLPLRSGSLVVCLECTDRILSRQLHADDRALIWCGSITRPPRYYNNRWRAAIGRDWDEAIHASDAARALAADLETDRHHAPREVDVRLLGADGQYTWYRVRFVFDAGVYGCAVDIDAERRFAVERSELLDAAQSARTAAENATQLKDEFLAAVSHELRAPLTTMLLWERVLRESSHDDASRTRALDAIHQSVVTQARLVSDLLDVARGISGKLYLDIRHVEIDRIVTEAFDAARPLALAKSIELVSKLGMVGGIHGDATRLRQIMDNLISNALKFTPPGGRITLSLRRRGRSISIDVEDTGRGIPPDLLTKIFEPFKQADDDISRREGGLGLGLTISKHLVDLHRGTLIATSRGLGLGARFTMTLPAAGNPRAPSPPVAVTQTARLDGARVLVIDDDARVREALGLLLGRAGVLVDTADSGAMGRARIAALAPDAVICDIAMPGEDGYSFARRLRASGDSVPAIAHTGYATQLDAERALEAGFDVHLPKPISFERLVESLGELLAARRERDT
jgi:signal transduction histidine kinase/ActR/RegA family two-component response regulator